MFPWIVAMQQECIIVLKAAAFVSYKLYQNVLQTLHRVRVALLLKATSESGESGFLTVCALVPGAQSSGPSSSLLCSKWLSPHRSLNGTGELLGKPTNCGEVTSVPSRGEEILLAASCYRNRDKLSTLWARQLQGFTIFFLMGGS